MFFTGFRESILWRAVIELNHHVQCLYALRDLMHFSGRATQVQMRDVINGRNGGNLGKLLESRFIDVDCTRFRLRATILFPFDPGWSHNFLASAQLGDTKDKDSPHLFDKFL